MLVLCSEVEFFFVSREGEKGSGCVLIGDECWRAPTRIKERIAPRGARNKVVDAGIRGRFVR